VESLIAGWVAGYSMAMASTVALTYLVFRARHSATFERWISSEVPSALLTVPIFLGAVLGWTMVGLILGAVYSLADLGDKPGALGSPSAPFLLGMAALAWLALPPLIMVWRREWRLWCLMSATFLGLFGWLMPLLAAR
jgi:hypothetical protein